MTSTSERLRTALDQLLDGLPPRQAAGAVEQLMSGYRDEGRGAAPPVLADRAAAVAYAAYRMPATFEAVAAALGRFADLTPGWAPAGHLDLGGGTGAAAWAAADVWPAAGRPTVVLDRAGPALDLGRELAGGRLDGVEWRQARLGAQGTALPAADLVTASYVLGELPAADRDALTDSAAAAGTAVVLVEPGTPGGYRRIRAARDRLIAAGLHVLAPCPHSGTCPVTGDDWCHFAARVSRSALHRRVKGGVLPYEDEKFAYVAAARDSVAGRPAPGRIVRRPLLRKGQVLLDLCTADGELRRETVSKRHREDYRAARSGDWGAPWPPLSPLSPDYPSETDTGQDVPDTRDTRVTAE
ncbi:small ribosomal subunit Rsm22 family protein [Streptomyces sp. MP131-18]|uniref:small ribosomal subunit Rsm22 family protein n=1 Tax=Streptomyces sp. MP131-18 TaxID=1857892 RepID=UPI00097BBEF6|nr:small ribosomal subunit Rsm22 family protein [Streptomyces sp. MP131-18]ONK14805.1 Ketopantoate hydroxymethyltransferase [Streptomyces sp. MP131-18]